MPTDKATLLKMAKTDLEKRATELGLDMPSKATKDVYVNAIIEEQR